MPFIPSFAPQPATEAVPVPESLRDGDAVFIAYPDAVLWGEPRPGEDKGTKPQNHLIFGDWAQVLEDRGEWVRIRCRRREGFVRRNQLQNNRILEVDFVDVGQGDGCHIVTPQDHRLLVDAGASDNMYRFVSWRYGRFRRPIQFHSAVISHPDADHYRGFQPLFEEPNARFQHVLHNGIIERVADSSLDELGPREIDPETRRAYLTGLIEDRDTLAALLSDPEAVGEKWFPTLMKTALDSGRVDELRALFATAEGSFVPGYGPGEGGGGEHGPELTFKVLGPVPEPDADGRPRLRLLDSSKSKTKNGHSVILRADYGKVSMLLGGDLNIPAEHYLLERYTGLSVPPANPAAEEELLRIARRTFEVDIAKACHHGSADFSELFLRALNARATIVSSGDNEPYCHPRPDTLGALGRYGRGSRPLIFSTELARSTKESIKRPNELRREMKQHLDVRDDPEASAEAHAAAREALDTFFQQLERSVARYGMINVRTDGERVLIAQKLETYRRASRKWDLHRFEADASGFLQYISRHGGH